MDTKLTEKATSCLVLTDRAHRRGSTWAKKDRRKATTLKVAAHLPAVLPKRQPPYTDSAGYLQRVDYT